MKLEDDSGKVTDVRPTLSGVAVLHLSVKKGFQQPGSLCAQESLQLRNPKGACMKPAQTSPGTAVPRAGSKPRQHILLSLPQLRTTSASSTLLGARLQPWHLFPGS